MAGAATVAVFALFHGHAHGTEVAEKIGGIEYMAGFALATATLHAVGIGIALAMKRGRVNEEDVDLMLSQRGLLGRIFRPAFRLIGRSWHMYPLGLLFGLGFDTATEVGLLGISAAQASQGLSLVVDPGVSRAVHRRYVAAGHHRQQLSW